MKTNQKHLHDIPWRLSNNAPHNGYHFPLAVFTNNASKRSPQDSDARAIARSARSDLRNPTPCNAQQNAAVAEETKTICRIREYASDDHWSGWTVGSSSTKSGFPRSRKDCSLLVSNTPAMESSLNVTQEDAIQEYASRAMQVLPQSRMVHRKTSPFPKPRALPSDPSFADTNDSVTEFADIDEKLQRAFHRTLRSEPPDPEPQASSSAAVETTFHADFAEWIWQKYCRPEWQGAWHSSSSGSWHAAHSWQSSWQTSSSSPCPWPSDEPMKVGISWKPI